MRVFHQTGFGKFTNDSGAEVSYPINRILLKNGKGELSIKLDSSGKRIIPFLIEKSGDEFQMEDEMGNKITTREIF